MLETLKLLRLRQEEHSKYYVDLDATDKSAQLAKAETLLGL